MKRLLIIAGSDSSGGAGIQADIKTASALGTYAATAITAITVQNTLGVRAVHPVPSDIIIGQIEAVMDDIGVDAVKIGMVGTADAIAAVADGLLNLPPGTPVVVDPVLVATSGDLLLEPGALDALKTRLIPMAAVLTPNTPEAEQLTGLGISSTQTRKQAAQRLLNLGCRSVLLKGGHENQTTITDLLVTADGDVELNHQRIDTRHTHGTGCTLSTAIAVNLAHGFETRRAVEAAQAYVLEAIATAPGFGRGHGPLNHLHTLRKTT